MDAGIADMLNRQAARMVARNMDRLDTAWGNTVPWYRAGLSETFLASNDATDSDRAWYFGVLAARTPGIDYDGTPADCDWENLFSHFRAEIEARRDPQSHSARAAEIPARDGVGSQ